MENANVLDQVLAQTENGNEAVVDRQVHIFYDNQAWDLAFDDLDVGMLSTDNEIKAKVAEALNVPLVKLANFRVQKNEETQSVDVRPNAVFGFFNANTVL
jgi:hypothetical protein